MDARHERLLALLGKALGHDLPNRLIALQGLARLVELEEGERLSAEGRGYLGRLAAGAEKAHALVADLAEAVRLERLAAPGGVDLAEVVAEAIAEAKQMAAGRPVTYHGSGQALIVSAPRPALHKVLVLLLRRAAAAGTGERPLRVDVSTRVTAAEVAIRVADDGAAIPGDQIERLFEPFTGEDGLGLFLVRQLAEGWGGAVRVESRPGRGTVFVVTCRPSV